MNARTIALPSLDKHSENSKQTVFLQDAAVATNRSAVPAEAKMINGRNVSCYPCHAGWVRNKQTRVCGSPFHLN